MTTTTLENIEQKFQSIEHRLIHGDSCSVASASWRDIDFKWIRQALKYGGKLKRKKVYGNIHYYYNGAELTREEAIQEVAKPMSLRQALVEANASVPRAEIEIETIE